MDGFFGRLWARRGLHVGLIHMAGVQINKLDHLEEDLHFESKCFSRM